MQNNEFDTFVSSHFSNCLTEKRRERFSTVSLLFPSLSMKQFKLVKYAGGFSTTGSPLPLSPLHLHRLFTLDMVSESPAADTASDQKPWYAAFPNPISSLENGTLSSINVSQLREQVKAQVDLNQRDFLVVDVRRTDFEVRSCSHGVLSFLLSRLSCRSLPLATFENSTLLFEAL